MSRLPLGSLVAQDRVVFTVIGTWHWVAAGIVARGSPPRDTRQVARLGSDPLTDREARGYALLPSLPGEPMRFVTWDEPLTRIA